MKQTSIVIVALLALVMSSAIAAAQPVPLDIEWVKINGDEFDGTQKFERGETLDIKVKVRALEDIEDAQLEASISGYRYARYERSMVNDFSKTFNLRENSSDTISLQLEIPVNMETEDTKLRIRVTDRNSESREYTYQLDIAGLADEQAVQIRDFTVSPSSTVEAGRPVSLKVTVKNYGIRRLDDVHVRVSIPELGIADDERISDIRVDQTQTFEELLLRIPICTPAGTYTVRADVYFDEYESTSKTMTINVLESGSCVATTPEAPRAKTVVTVPDNQEVVIGTTGAVYPVMISNLGTTAKTYTLSATGAELWGTVRMDPSAVVIVQPESVKTIYMYVTAKEDAQAGAQVFKLVIESEDDSKQVVLTANIQESAPSTGNDGLRRGLEIGLIVLVIVLILLGLIIGFNKLKGDKRENDDETQTYY